MGHDVQGLSAAHRAGRDGREAAARMRTTRGEVKVLYMSGYTTAIAGQQIGLLPPDAFLQKPFSLDVLLREGARSAGPSVRRCRVPTKGRPFRGLIFPAFVGTLLASQPLFGSDQR